VNAPSIDAEDCGAGVDVVDDVAYFRTALERCALHLVCRSLRHLAQRKKPRDIISGKRMALSPDERNCELYVARSEDNGDPLFF